MVRSLFQEIKDLINGDNSIPWKYYQHWSPNINADSLFSEQDSISFIKDYFTAGAKESPLCLDPFGENYKNEFTHRNKESLLSDNTFSIDNLHGDRVIHTVSAFFLGILIENALFGNNHLTASVNGDDEFTFPYLWFLTCLYHDIGYQFEQDKEYHSSIKRHLHQGYYPTHKAHSPSHALDAVFRSLDISLSNSHRYRSRIHGINLSHALYTELLSYARSAYYHPVHYSNGAIIRNGWYQKQLINNYFDYRFWDMNVCDHGIVGGSLFLDRIIKNYVATYISECVRQRNIIDLDGFNNTTSGLHFSKHQLPIFHHISDCILAHNVYKAAECKVDTYLAFGLDKLIGTSFEPVCVEKDPLLYILSISDTLDPVKKYCTGSELSAMEVLKNVSFDFVPGRRSMMVSVNKSVSIDPIYEAANSLKTWTVATVSSKTDNSFMISL